MGELEYKKAWISSESGGSKESTRKWMGREKSEIWQVGCRPVSKRDTLFSAWLRDNDEPQIRMKEEVPRNLSGALQRLMLRQGCFALPRFHFPAENVTRICYTTVITLHLVMQNECPWNGFCIKLDDKTKEKENSLLYKAWAATHDVLCQGPVPHIWKQSKSTEEVQKDWIHYWLHREHKRSPRPTKHHSQPF